MQARTPWWRGTDNDDMLPRRGSPPASAAQERTIGMVQGPFPGRGLQGVEDPETFSLCQLLYLRGCI